MAGWNAKDLCRNFPGRIADIAYRVSISPDPSTESDHDEQEDANIAILLAP